MTHKCTPFCEILCVEKRRAILQDGEKDANPRTRDQLINAPIESKAIAGGPLVERAIFQEQLPTIYRDPVPPYPELIRYPFGFSSVDSIPPGFQSSIHCHPCLSFIPEAFRVASECLDFEMTPPAIGYARQAVGTTQYLPCSAFAEWKRWDMTPITPANQIHFHVVNRGKEARVFRAVMFGRILECA